MLHTILSSWIHSGVSEISVFAVLCDRIHRITNRDPRATAPTHYDVTKTSRPRKRETSSALSTIITIQ